MRKSNVKIVKLNAAQLLAIEVNRVAKKKFIYLEMGRGAGKSTILGWYVKEAVRQMPRATGVIVCETYKQALERTLPSTKEGLEMFGIFEGYDYVVGKSGERLGFEMPFQRPSNWRNVIHFRNGAIAILVSLDLPNAGRGINSYWVIGDEAALLNKDRLFLNVQTTNRAKKSQFANASLLNAEIFASSTPLTKKGRWFVDMEEEARRKPDKFAFIKANALVNQENLEADWFERMLANAPSQLHYDAEILNIRPPNVLNGFYVFFDESKHCYGSKFDLDYLQTLGKEYKRVQHDTCAQDGDLIKGQPITISIDPGTVINSMTVWQYLYSQHEERTLKEFFVKSPKDYEDMIKDFDAYYQPHKLTNNTLYLRHDAQAFKERDKNGQLTSEKIEKKLRGLGWRVVNHTPKTNNPLHSDKHVVMNAILKENDPRLPKWRINENNCPNLVISVSTAEVEVKKTAKGTNDFGKDKSSERDPNTLPEHATHLSDTADYYLFWKWADVVREDGRSSFFIPIS